MEVLLQLNIELNSGNQVVYQKCSKCRWNSQVNENPATIVNYLDYLHVRFDDTCETKSDPVTSVNKESNPKVLDQVLLSRLVVHLIELAVRHLKVLLFKLMQVYGKGS